MFNRVILVGRIGQDPEMRYTPSGNAVTNFSIATNRKWRNREGKLDEETTWHDIVCWGKTAEFISEYAGKGSLVFIEGRIQKRSWDDKDGNKRYSVEVVASNVQLLDRRSDRDDRKGDSGKDTGEVNSEEGEPGPDTGTEDDVPF